MHRTGFQEPHVPTQQQGCHSAVTVSAPSAERLSVPSTSKRGHEAQGKGLAPTPRDLSPLPDLVAFLQCHARGQPRAPACAHGVSPRPSRA